MVSWFVVTMFLINFEDLKRKFGLKIIYFSKNLESHSNRIWQSKFDMDYWFISLIACPSSPLHLFSDLLKLTPTGFGRLFIFPQICLKKAKNVFT